MKVMIVITGLTCNGKSYMTYKIRDKYKLIAIHTDSFYSPLDGNIPNSKVGVDDKVKREYFTRQKEEIGDVFIVEGSHVGNQKELDLYKEYLDFDGEVIVYEAKNERKFERWFIGKYGSYKDKDSLVAWFKKTYNIKPDKIVRSYLEIEGDLIIRGII